MNNSHYLISRNFSANPNVFIRENSADLVQNHIVKKNSKRDHKTLIRNLTKVIFDLICTVVILTFPYSFSYLPHYKVLKIVPTATLLARNKVFTYI